MNRFLTGVGPLAVLSVLLLIALIMMAAATQNSALFGNIYWQLLIANLMGIVLLVALIALNLRKLVKQLRARTMGSRLTLRLVGFFVLLAVIPVTVVYVFSIQAFNKGIDSWFDVKIEHALNDALALGRTALDALKQDLEGKTRDMALELELGELPERAAAAMLNDLREHYGVSEITLFAVDGRIIASAGHGGLEARSLVPDQPHESLLSQARQGLTVSTIDPMGRSGLQLRVLAPVHPHDLSAPSRILQVLQQLPDHYSKLGDSVQAAFAEYEKLLYLRGPLKFGFTLTLTLVALLTLLTAVWAAIFTARRLVTPIRDLAEGTRAVAQGNYRKQLPVPGKDELGVLVQSFNEMTLKIHRAQIETKHSQREAEVQRTYLETILTHLSSGVLSFDPRMRLRTHNTSADQILGVDLHDGAGRTLKWVADAHPQLKPFVDTVQEAFAKKRSEWHAEVGIHGQTGRRILILRGTMMPGLRGRHGGHVVVFDDITALIQAQRDAAWGEVARRLAHEIKNPLTPIQLSAERIRHKCMDGLAAPARDTLDRATRTIVEQVESLKAMVNAFSDYARPVPMQPEPVDINALIRDVVELYRGRHYPVDMRLDLDPAAPPISADPGRLRQVLHNLVLNAVDALADTPAPALTLQTRASGRGDARWVELQVCDNGPGFDAAVMDRLFEPYVTTKDKGTGLGLAIVKKIVEEHNGALWAENPGEGGARLTIRLPAPAADHGDARAPTAREKSA
jgi:nitrogen fixation/metabolism regulation signal transduction histidine kinase